MDIITIKNFEKHNPRKDRKKHSWVRVDNTIAWAEDLEGLDPDQKWFWIFLISQASFKQSDAVQMNISYFAKHSGVSIKKIESAIDHFKKHNMIQVVPQSVTTGDQSVTDGNQMETTGIPTYDTYDTYDTNIRNDTIQGFFDFWNSLPFKVPKALKLTDERREKIKNRILETKNDLEPWKEAMLKIGESNFLLGIDPKSDGWCADIDWLINNETNRIKILEGKYKNKARYSPPPQNNKAQAVVDDLRNKAERVKAGLL